MDGISLVKFRPKHLGEIAGEVNEPFLIPILRDNAQGCGEGLFYSGPAYTLRRAEQIIGCGGVVLMWEGTGTAWLALGSLADKYPLAVSKASKKILALIKDECALNRIETVIDGNSPRNLKFASFLGFKREGTLVKYHGGKDFEMVAIT